jgi:hypothetical protein
MPDLERTLAMDLQPTEHWSHDGSRILTVLAGRGDAAPFALELALLHLGLADGVTLRGPEGSTLRLTRDAGGPSRVDPGGAGVVLSRTDLEIVLTYACTYHRDGPAAVHHVAVALEGRPPTTLVVTAADAEPPGPGEEAIRLLEGR